MIGVRVPSELSHVFGGHGGQVEAQVNYGS